MAREASNGMLGSLVWWTIAGDEEGLLAITREDLLSWFEELGLDPAFLPGPSKGVDAFRAASSALEFEYTVEGRRIKVTVNETAQTNEYVTRHLIRTVQDGRGKQVGTRVAELQFYRPVRTAAGRRHGTETWRHHLRADLPLEERRYIEAAIKRFDNHYEKARKYVSTTTMRAIVRDYLVNLNAITIKKTSGIYFIHDHQADIVTALSQLVERCGNGCYVHQVPLVDDETQRTMLVRAFEDQVIEDVRVLLNDVEVWKDRNTGKQLSQTRYSQFRGRYEALATYSEEHARRLGIPQERTADALEEALNMITDLYASVGVGARG